MSTLRGFLLPDLGEGLTEAELLSWSVRVGDAVTVDEPLCEVETAKAVVELPSPFAGTVARLYVDPGDSVEVGATLIDIDVADAGDAGDATNTTVSALRDDVAPSGRQQTRLSGEDTSPERIPVEAAPGPAGPTPESAGPPTLVGSGPLDEADGPSTHRSWRRRSRPSSSGSLDRSLAGGDDDHRRPAVPAARRAAREHGIDIDTVTAAGADRIITEDDVARHIASTATSGAPSPAVTGHRMTSDATAAPDGNRTRATALRRATAEAVTRSARTVPHATAFRSVDMTDSLTLLHRLQKSTEYAGIRLSPLTLVANAAIASLRRFPAVNSLWDDDTGDIIRRQRVNLSLAVAGDRGLTVPNIKDAHRLGLHGLAQAITEVVDAARASASSVEGLSGGTFTITNIGVFGLESGTAVIPPGQSAILSLGVIDDRPWVHEGRLAIRSVATVGLTFDHRLLDGAEAGGFLASVSALLENPLRLAE